MKEQTRIKAIEDRKTEGHLFPKSILSVSRKELQQVQLKVKKGLTEENTTVPDDLRGHIFILAPVGSVASPKLSDRTVLPSKDGWTPLLNGDGMIYRLDFQGGKAQLTTKIVKTPCYYSDLICDRNFTWATAFYAYQDRQPTRQFQDIYWNSWGCWRDLLTQRTVDAYRSQMGSIG